MPQFQSHDGVRLYYTDEGHGVPILCLSGLTRNGRDFGEVAPTLTNHRMITMDYRGRGRSDWAHEETYTIPVEAQDALALLDHLGIERAAILGTSRGGLIAILLAATAPERLLGAALNDIGPVIDPRGMQAIADYLGRAPAWTTLDEAAAGLALTPGFENVPQGHWRRAAERRFDKIESGLILTYDPRLREAVLGVHTGEMPDLWPLFEALRPLPTALIRGVNSDILSRETAAEMARRHPDMIWAEVPERAHVPFLDEAEATDALTSWLELL